jgi:outer membrane scaffolding protein for murein synthesis (MipA/OmpV family)
VGDLDPVRELPYGLAALIIAASEAGQMAASDQVSDNPKIACAPGGVHRWKAKIMSSVVRQDGLCLAVVVVAIGVATPATAQVVVPARVLPAPIIPPPFVVVPDLPNTEAGGEGIAPDRLTLVVGAAAASDYEGSNDYILAPVAGATARLHGHAIVWQGNSLGVDLVPEYRGTRFKFIVAPFINLNLNRTGISHDPIVALIGKSAIAAEGGIVLGFNRTGIFTSRYDSLTVQVSMAHDLGSVYKSYIISPSVAYTTPLSKSVLVSASAGFDVVGAGYARHYFGVDHDASASSGLPYYRPSGGVKSAGFGLGGAVSLNGDLRKGFAVGAKLNYQRLLGEFAASPIVASRGSRDQFSVTIGLAYTL